MSKFLSVEKPIFYEPGFEKMSLFNPLNALIFPSPEPQTIDFQLEINFRQTLMLIWSNTLAMDSFLYWPLIVLLLGTLSVVVFIVLLRLHAFIALLLGAIIVGVFE